MADGRIVIDTEVDSSGAERGLKKTTDSARSQAAKLAAEYKKQGMSASEAFKKAWSEIERDSSVQADKTAKNWKGSTDEISNIAKNGLSVLKGVVVATGTAIATMGTIGVKYNAELEQYMSSFTTMLGSAEKATAHLDELKQFAAKTPFELGDLAKASTTLQAFGTDAKDITPTLKMLGDISLGNKEKFNGLALVFGQVQSQGKLMGQDLMQMINQGFNPLQIISEKTGKSMSQLKDEMSKGQISFEMVAEAMQIATSEGGKFYNAMEGQSKTLVGQWSTLKDNVNAFLGDMFTSVSEVLTNKLLPKANEVIEKLQEAFSNGELKESVNRIAESFGNLISSLADLISDWLPKIIQGFAWVIDNGGTIIAVLAGIKGGLLALKVAGIIMDLAGAFKGVKTATEAWTVAQKLLNIQLFANPIGLIVAAIAGLVVGIVVLWKTNEGFRNAVINAWNKIKEVASSVWGGICDFFTKTIPEAFNSVKTFFTETVPNWFMEQVNKAKENIVNGWNAIIAFFTETIPAWIENIINWFNQLPYMIGNAFGQVLGAIIKWGIDTWNYLYENVPLWLESIGNWFAELPERVGQWLLDTLERIKNWAIEMHNRSQEAGQQFVDSITNWFSELPGRIYNWFVQTISKVIAFKEEMKRKADEAASNFVSNLVEGVKELPEKFKNIGKDIAKGAWEGIKSMGSWLLGRVTGFFGGLVDGVKSSLGIHSPSRVFRDQVGKYMAQGVGVGFEGESKNIQSDMENSLSKLTSKMQAAVEFETASTTASIVAENNSSVGSTSTNTYNPKFNVIAKVVVPLDGEIIAEHTTPMVIETIGEEQNSYSKARGGI